MDLNLEKYHLNEEQKSFLQEITFKILQKQPADPEEFLLDVLTNMESDILSKNKWYVNINESIFIINSIIFITALNYGIFG